ncbi:MAG: type 1 glutamine amidotransferase [Actinomycetota bacterium]
MEPVLFVRNDTFETFGLARSAFEPTGVRVEVFDAIDPAAPRPSLADVSGVVMFGSSHNVDETDAHPFLKEIRDLTREAVERGLPYLGICLGAQVLARALDRPAPLAPRREVGFEPVRPTEAAGGDRLLSHYADGDPVFQWHQDTFELPDGAELLATGDAVPLQAYRVNDVTWGVQWHFEIDRAEVDLWLDAFSAEGDLEATWGKSSAEVRREADQHMAAHEARGAETFRRFAEVVRERS